jgi:hypothetical protein
MQESLTHSANAKGASLKIEHLNGLENKHLKVTQSQPREVPEGMPKLSFLMNVVGSRGSGKTNAVINLVKMYDKCHSFDKLYLFSPTYHNEPKNKLYHEGSYKMKVYTTYSDDIFREVLEEIKTDIDEYKEYLRKKKLYEKFLKIKRIEELTPEEIIELDIDNWEEPTTEWKHGMPTSLLIFDDLVGNKDLYRADGKGIFYNFVILHRHLLTSVIFLSQVVKNGVPRQIRNNLSSLILFSNKSESIKKELAEEFSSFCKPEKFIEMWDFACQEPHEFFMIDMDASGKNKKYRFRRNFDTLILEDAGHK